MRRHAPHRTLNSRAIKNKDSQDLRDKVKELLGNDRLMAEDWVEKKKEEIVKKDVKENSIKEDRKMKKKFEKLDKIGRFLWAAEKGKDQEFFKSYIKEGGDINVQDPMTGDTALHHTCGTSSKLGVEILLNTGKCDFLIKNKRNEIPYVTAMKHCQNEEIIEILGQKTKEQADKKGMSRSELIKLSMA